MDEPTTHLDMAEHRGSDSALEQYEGTLVFISHDVYFIKSIASSVLHVRGGALTSYPGNYDYYLEKTGTESAVAGLVADGKSIVTGEKFRICAKGQGQKRLEADARQSRSRAKQEIQKDLSTLEERILRTGASSKRANRAFWSNPTAERSVHPAQAGRELTSAPAGTGIALAGVGTPGRHRANI